MPGDTPGEARTSELRVVGAVIARLAADALVVLHAAFVVFVVLGGFLTWRCPCLIWAQVPCAVYGVLLEAFGWMCPLTPLEVGLRVRAGESGYQGGFVEHYLVPLIYPPGLTERTQWVLGAIVVLTNAVAYIGFVLRRRERQSRPR